MIADIASYSLFKLMNHIYFTMNANDFEAAVGLFAPNGALQPPFQKPIIGQEAVLSYMREECQNEALLNQSTRVIPRLNLQAKSKRRGLVLVLV